MSRWTYMDEDEYRLPEGMERIGYDADTQTYTYRDESGRTYEGDSGNRYGKIHPVQNSRRATIGTSVPIEKSRWPSESSTDYKIRYPYKVDQRDDNAPLAERITAPFQSIRAVATSAIGSTFNTLRRSLTLKGPSELSRSQTKYGKSWPRSVSQPSQYGETKQTFKPSDISDTSSETSIDGEDYEDKSPTTEKRPDEKKRLDEEEKIIQGSGEEKV